MGGLGGKDAGKGGAAVTVGPWVTVAVLGALLEVLLLVARRHGGPLPALAAGLALLALAAALARATGAA